MASATYPDEKDSPPPPYAPYDVPSDKAPYQQQIPQPVHAPQFPSYQPSPIPVYTQAPVMVSSFGASFLGHTSAGMQCPRCHQQIFTVVQHEPSSGTFLISFLICFFGGILGCCLIPFCVPSCQDALHTCPSCRYLIGRRTVL